MVDLRFRAVHHVRFTRNLGSQARPQEHMVPAQDFDLKLSVHVERITVCLVPLGRIGGCCGSKSVDAENLAELVDRI